MDQKIIVLPCIFSYEVLKWVVLTSQKVLSEEPDDLGPVKVLSVNSAMTTQVDPILTVRVPSKSCHSGLLWRAREKKMNFLSSVAFTSAVPGSY